MRYFLKNSDNVIAESIYNNDKTEVNWSNVTDFSVTLQGNYSQIEAETTTDTNGEFTYYIPESFATKNTRASVYIELSFNNANFDDGVENIKQKIYDITFKE